MNLFQLTPMDVGLNLTNTTFSGEGGTEMKKEYYVNLYILSLINELLTSFLDETIGLIFFPTSSQIDGLHYDTVGHFSS